MRYLIALALVLWGAVAAAQEWEDRKLFQSGAGRDTLRILSSTDTAYLSPLITGFVKDHGDAQVEYLVAGTADIYRLVQETPAQYDLIISSAMDLQIKLVNDGFAKPLEGVDYPDWAHWRHSLFGFTAEPAAVVVNAAAFDRMDLPATRQDLIALLRQKPDQFRGRVATYDIRRSGLGYLFAAQDARTSETYWRLTEVMGGLGTKLYCCSGEMIDDVASGEVLVAYNVLGSYAAARAANDPRIRVILPTDFATTMMRTMYVAKDAEHQTMARSFLEYTLSAMSGPAYSRDGPLPQLFSQSDRSKRQMIPLEPSLMIYLDRLKRDAFVREWESAVIQ